MDGTACDRPDFPLAVAAAVLWNDVAFNICAYVPLGAALVLVWPRRISPGAASVDRRLRGDPVVS